MTKRWSLKKFKVHLDSKIHLNLKTKQNKQKHHQFSSPCVARLQFYTPCDNILNILFTEIPIRDEISFKALFRDVDQFYFLRVQAREQRYRFSGCSDMPASSPEVTSTGINAPAGYTHSNILGLHA